MSEPRGTGKDPNEPWITPGVVSIGAASFFSDSGHEIATSLMPAFLTSVLGGSAAPLGVIEGISDALTGVTKVVGGPLANDPGRRRSLATGGYIFTAVATAAIGLATTVWQVGVLRAFAWAARGVRSPARDSVLGSLANPNAYGRSFGIERVGDNLGAVVGPLLAAGLVAWVGIRPAIWFSFIPGILAAVAIIVAAREAKRRFGDQAKERVRLNIAGLRSAGLGRPLVPILLFECGNLATTMLILRATDQLTALGFASAASLAILFYAGHNAIAAAISFIGGVWLDRAGPRIVFAAGAAAYVLGYAAFSVPSVGWVLLLVGFVLAGAGIGLAETAESALVARTLPDRVRGSGFGVLGGIQAVRNIVGTVVAGILYTTLSPTAAFVYAAAWMLLSLAASVFFTHPSSERTS
ncbi:MFS transporter [Leifsonia aquatica]|uniref:MFS transporter n=1 Tax=Leifsonia aquatica TaxID=144185 RepID=UPI00046911A3|nr:MFS transporter [Leifsonia aquatica]